MTEGGWGDAERKKKIFVALLVLVGRSVRFLACVVHENVIGMTYG